MDCTYTAAKIRNTGYIEYSFKPVMIVQAQANKNCSVPL